ncbi:tetratricopeptide repeat protein [Kitasatospora sp. NPDC006697]|uniref:tetratricopeptide repeat protein n=1 Tax=Kitasatospora sp. NPDC006697 TaxID=3364020 RepID=UPI0036AFAD9F
MTSRTTADPRTPADRTPAEEYDRARLHFDSKAYSDAARILQPLVAAEPGQLAARMLLARSYYHSAQLERAAAELREVLAQDPAESYAHLMLGRTLERQGRGEEARPHLRLAAAMNDAFA